MPVACRTSLPGCDDRWLRNGSSEISCVNLAVQVHKSRQHAGSARDRCHHSITSALFLRNGRRPLVGSLRAKPAGSWRLRPCVCERRAARSPVFRSPRSLLGLPMNAISTSEISIWFTGICFGRLLKQRSALRKPDVSFDLPPPRGGLRSLSVGVGCIATKSRALSELFS